MHQRNFMDGVHTTYSDIHHNSHFFPVAVHYLLQGPLVQQPENAASWSLRRSAIPTSVVSGRAAEPVNMKPPGANCLQLTRRRKLTETVPCTRSLRIFPLYEIPHDSMLATAALLRVSWLAVAQLFARLAKPPPCYALDTLGLKAIPHLFCRQHPIAACKNVESSIDITSLSTSTCHALSLWFATE